MLQIIVVTPHPDDETLGCGGALLRYKNEGHDIHWLIVTSVKEEDGFDSEIVENRRLEIEKISKVYGFSSVHDLNFSTTKLDMYPKSELISKISSVFNQIKPDTLFLPYRNDVHSDHEIVFDTAIACTKSFRYPYIKNVLVYETLSETEFTMRPDANCFKPNCWIDISDYLDQKIDIMKLYKSEIADYPFPRSEKNIRALATLRGATAGVHAAEAFMIVKQIK